MHFLGVLVAEQTVELCATEPGRIVRMPAQLGQLVTKGALLAAFDNRRLMAERQEALASLSGAQAHRKSSSLTAEHAAILLQRRRALRSDTPQALSQDEWERTIFDEKMARARLAQDEEDVKQRQARVQQIDAALATTELHAPWIGIVAARYVAEGATVVAGQPVLRLLGSSRPLVRFLVPETRLRDLSIGQRFCFASDSARGSTAHIIHIAPEVDEAMGLIVVEARLDSALPAGLQLGVQVRVDLHCEKT